MRVMVAFSAFVTGRNSIGESSYSLLYFSEIALRVVIGGAFCFWILIRLPCFFMPHKVCQDFFFDGSALQVCETGTGRGFEGGSSCYPVIV